MPVIPPVRTILLNDHKDLVEGELHYPKGYTLAGRESYPVRSVHGELDWEFKYYQQPVIGFTSVASSAPSDGDRYIFTGVGSSAAFGGASTNDIVSYLTVDSYGRNYNSWDYITPQEGTLVYATTLNTFYYFDGSSWKDLAAGLASSPWNKSGSIVKLGTITDDVGIGTATPQTKLDVVGDFLVEDTVSDTEGYRAVVTKDFLGLGELVGFEALNINNDPSATDEQYLIRYQGFTGFSGIVIGYQNLDNGDINKLTADKIAWNWDTEVGADFNRVTGSRYGFLITNNNAITVATETLDVRGTMRLVDGSQGNGKVLECDANGVTTWVDLVSKIYLFPTYANDVAAGVGGLVAGQIYKTATGELRIKL